MADLSVDMSNLPDEIRDKLAELDLELSEGKLYSVKVCVSHRSIIC